MDDTGQYYPIHLLGTGHPLSLLIYSACGADSFDGLEWCQTTVDYKTGFLYHFQQREFFGNQSPFCSMDDFPYVQATLAHNLLFFNEWMKKIQDALRSNGITEMMAKYLPKPFLQVFSSRLPEVYPC